MNSIERRLAALERGNRRLKVGLGVSWLAVGIAAALGLTQVESASDSKVVRAERFEVVDSDGRVYVALDKLDGAGMVITSDAAGKPLSVLAAEKGLSGRFGIIATFGSAGEALVGLGATDLGFGTVTTYNKTGDRLTALTSNEEGDGLIETYGGPQLRHVSIGSGPQHAGFIALMNDDGQHLIELGAITPGRGAISTFDTEGRMLVGIGAMPDGRGLVDVRDPNGRGERATLRPER
jgi:hypothetical protein